MLAAHDFFDPQPVTDADVFVMRAVVHDWSDTFADKILKRLREAAQPHTRLLCVEKIIPYACKVDKNREISGDGIPGTIETQVPEPLPANFGGAQVTPYIVDMNVCVVFVSNFD